MQNSLTNPQQTRRQAYHHKSDRQPSLHTTKNTFVDKKFQLTNQVQVPPKREREHL